MKLVFAAKVAMSFAIATVALAQMVAAAPMHYFVVSEDGDGALRLYSHRIVDIDITETHAVTGSSSDASEQAVSIEFVDKRTQVASLRGIATAATWIRGEFHGSPHDSGVGHAIESTIAPASERVYVIRVPVEANQVLRLKKLTGQTRGAAISALGSGALDIDLDQVPATLGTAALPANYDAGTVLDNGPSSNRLDLLIMGDGYTLAQKAKFITDATNLANTFLNIAPYSTFKHLINVHWLFVPSNQSGADKPPGSDCLGTVVLVDTAFDGKFCTSNIRRLVTVSNSKVNAAAAAVPGWDTIMVLVNDTEYGGAGGSMSVITTHPAAVQVAQHEFGHTFTRLADEYTTPYPGFPACSDLSGSSPCETNVTDQTVRASIKWSGWIAATTPIPTTDPIAADPLSAGLWKGARYLGGATDTMYRQCFNGAMRSLGAPFCHVDREAFVKRLYAPGTRTWGVPSGGVDLIETKTTPLSLNASALRNSTFTLRARVAGSLTPLTYEWRVNGSLVAGGFANHGETVAYPFTVPSSGNTSVELRVTDSTPFLLTPHTRTRTWTITAAAHALNVEKLGSGSGTVNSAPVGVACGATCTLVVAAPETVTLSAVANVGSRFVGWLGACVGTGTCSVSVNGVRNVRAVFAPSSSVASLDIDSNGQIDALTDGALALRYLTETISQPSTRNLLGARAARTSTSSINQHLENISPTLDVDGNGELAHANDGLLIIRYLLGFRGGTLIANAIGGGATRSTASTIESHLQALMIPN